MDAQSLRRIFVLANPFKEGDLLVGGTRDDRVREEARRALGATTLGEIRHTAIVDDRLTETLAKSLDPSLQAELDPLTVNQLRERLLSATGPAWVDRHRDGLSSEAIAAAVKLMTDEELSTTARSVFNPLPGNGITVGSPRHFGSRIQPNSPGDNEDEILFSILEGLSFGCGDVVIGLNPATDNVDTIVALEELLGRVVERLELPTHYCVLSDLVKQHAACARTPIDIAFQSLAGTSRALVSMVGLDVDGVLDLARSFGRLYFETGQGSAVTNGVAEGVDMVTLEARAYGVARYIRRETGAWLIVNDVAGFIGPEVFRTPQQLERACMEDVVMAKVHGLTMGLDVCATFHMGIAPATLRRLTERVVARALPAYLMAVAGNADPMLGYLTTSFREHPRLRHQSDGQVTSAMASRLSALGVNPTQTNGRSTSTAQLYAAFRKASGSTSSLTALVADGEHKLHELREQGYELGATDSDTGVAERAADERVDQLYSHARLALYATLDVSILSGALDRHVRVRTLAADRDDYLAHPPRGEQLRLEDVALVERLYPADSPPQLQFVISDGLNANAINEQLPALLPSVRQLLLRAGVTIGGVDVLVENGRVRAGYHVGQLVSATALVHFIGERPGTGLNSMSAYLTYGRDSAGVSRWSHALDHSCTAAVCGIHPRGKPSDIASEEIARAVLHMLKSKQSGVAVPRR